uniref:Putative hat family dimerization domain protein n=1 Tax=Amblyomma tuberculatum TaxID=48802 RepID=A0A6M2E0F6_9ACAR
MKLVHERKLIAVFPNLSIALRMYLTARPMIKNCLRSSHLDDKVNSLAIMSIESDLLRDLSFERTVYDFGRAKARKMPF